MLRENGRKTMSRIVTLGLKSLSRGCESNVRSSLKGRGNPTQCRLLNLPAGTNAVMESSVNDSYKVTSEVNSPKLLEISYPVYMIWGANTDVGKTLVAAGLSASILSKRQHTAQRNVDKAKCVTARDVLYIKPVQTGYPNDSDARFVTGQVFNILKGSQHENESKFFFYNQTLQASLAVHQAVNSKEATFEDGVEMKHLGNSETQILEASHRRNFSVNCHDKREVDASATNPRSDAADHMSLRSHLTCTTLWAWYNPVSPHLAADKERAVVDDSSLLHTLTASLQSFANNNREKAEEDGTYDPKEGFNKWAIVETAGGVASPGPSGTLQCDIYRPLRLPGVLVGDGRLGGISTTISSFESLRARGYDVEAIILLDSAYGNDLPLLRYLQRRVPVLVLPPVPTDPKKDLAGWYSQSKGVFSELQSSLEKVHIRRMQRLQEMPIKAEQVLWWPFTQHSMIPAKDITVIDSRCGHTFSVHKSAPGIPRDVLVQQFDACASWWTQGPDAYLQPELAREVGYAAARYGHVMFPENVYEPALHCAELLLQKVGKGWAKRVYFSDNGSTAIEIALKMAFRKFITDRGFLTGSDGAPAPFKNQPQLKVLALRGSYHGDTLGAMEAQAPSSYTGFRQQPWYHGRGLFLDPPTVYLRSGRWLLHFPASFGRTEHIQDLDFGTREDIFDLARDHTSIGDAYRLFINQQLSHHKTQETDAIAALIIEPVIHAAGGMEMIDPLFQRILVHECQRQNIPVIFDEVFAGCWRLGVESAAELLDCCPDIACYAKLLTGGTIPLAATLATEDVFDVFQGKSKLDALLHGHSYSAHALGCAAAVTSLKYFGDPLQNFNLLSNGRLQELWDPELISEISSHPSVQRVVALGTVFACELQTSPEESGYASTSTKNLIQSLRKDGIYARPLGNVVYLMCGPLTPPRTCTVLLETLRHHLGLDGSLITGSNQYNSIISRANQVFHQEPRAWVPHDGYYTFVQLTDDFLQALQMQLSFLGFNRPQN